MTNQALLPAGWPRPKGYSNGFLTKPGKVIFLAGQVGWDPVAEKFNSPDIVPQFEQALKNIVALLAEGGAKPEHLVRMTCFCCDRDAYLAARPQLGEIWKRIIGKHYPGMTMIFVVDLLDHPAKMEIEATAVIPD
ncbi:MAG: RidA family protein [Rhodospirillales bacterium]|jgi:enamine deaminase RidA (YjgF/YER057c/UK114 family)|nr:RidA family protein [Rhodospirillales bacterium]